MPASSPRDGGYDIVTADTATRPLSRYNLLTAEARKEGAIVESIGSRIDRLTKQLLANSVARAADRNEAYLMAHRAFVDILRKRPEFIDKADLLRTDA
jgi:hypothetical protein